MKVYWEKMRELQAQVQLETQKILYGVDQPGVRRPPCASSSPRVPRRWRRMFDGVPAGNTPAPSLPPQAASGSLRQPPVCPQARAEYENEFGCVRWTAPALAKIAALGPLVEIGAGAGHWQRALTQAGAFKPETLCVSLVSTDSLPSRLSASRVPPVEF